MGVLQTPALPLGYVAISLERKTRLELATSSLARRHSTTELLPQLWLNSSPKDIIQEKTFDENVKNVQYTGRKDRLNLAQDITYRANLQIYKNKMMQEPIGFNGQTGNQIPL